MYIEWVLNSSLNLLSHYEPNHFKKFLIKLEIFPSNLIGSLYFFSQLELFKTCCKYWLKINNSLIWGFAFVFHSITYCLRPMCKYFHIFYYFFNLSLSITLSRYLYLSFYYIYLQTHVSICLSINLSFYTSIYKSIYQSIINHIRPMGQYRSCLV